MTLPPSYSLTYDIRQECVVITCHTCRLTSHAPGDVEHLYCGYCHVFHEDRDTFAAVFDFLESVKSPLAPH